MNKTNVSRIIEEKVAKKLKEQRDTAKKIGVATALVLTGEGGGRWVIDMSCDPATIRMDAKAPAVTTITTETSLFIEMATGKLNPQDAFLSGKVKVDGNLSVAMKLGQFLT